jgi:hypothetical protein
VARRATYMKQQHSSGEQQLILDSGDFVGGRGKKDQLSGEYLLKALSQLNYDAINLGERDFLLGLQFLTDLKEKYHLPFISANVFQSDGKKTVFPLFIIKELKEFHHGDTIIPSVRVGIFGVMMYRSQLTFEQDDSQLIIKDPIEAASDVMAQLKDKCDFIVGLVHLPYSQLTNFIQSVKGIDVVIAGHDPIMRMEPQKIENTLVIVGGNRGQYIGDLRLVLNQQKKIVDFEGKVVSLDEKIKNDPEMVKLIQEYKKQETSISYEINRERYRSMEMYVGATKCKECHEEQYSQWKKTAHAKAFKTLQDEQKGDDLNCAKCHTTGFAQYNGFYTLKETPQMTDVQCEACHGIGKLHVQSVERMKSQKLKAAILAPISEETCTTCHNKARDPKFDYEKDLKKVKH